MVFRAKFSGTCPVCGKHINEGDEINWEKGRKATHKACGNVAAPSAPAPYRKRGRGCTCTQDCCAHGCECDSHCNCRGGNIYDC